MNGPDPELDPDVPPQAVPLVPLLLVVAVGGALGALARYAVGRALPTDAGQLPWGTLLVNVSGCLVLGLLVGAWPRARWLRPFAGTGVLGGYTTFSTFALESDRLLGAEAAVAMLYVGLSLLVGVAVAALGLWAGARWRGSVL